MSSRYAYDDKKPAVLVGYCTAKLARCFNALRPSLGGRYAEAITTDSEDPQGAIRRFKRKEYPRIAVSVGMLDTSFDCPGVVNIVFCRATRSEVLYKQIRGRRTRLCEGKESYLTCRQMPRRKGFM